MMYKLEYPVRLTTLSFLCNIGWQTQWHTPETGFPVEYIAYD